MSDGAIGTRERVVRRESLQRARAVPGSTYASAAAVLSVVVVSLLLRWLVPAYVIADAAHDDLLFTSHAARLQDGNWLGPFDPNLTLAKGVGYPLFLALSGVLQIPVLMAQQALLIIASGLVATVVWRLTGTRVLAISLFAALALNPAFLGVQASRIIRDNWYSSVCLLLFGAMVALLLVPRSSAVWTGARGTAVRVGGSAAIGLLMAMYWIGREERPWLLPTLLFLLVAPVVVRRDRSGRHGRRPQSRQGQGRTLVRRAWPAAVAAAVFGGMVGSVAAANQHVFGVSLTNDVTEGNFPGAFAAWQSVEAGEPRQYVPISSEQRRAVYAQSAAARELEPFIESPAMAWTVEQSCTFHAVCDDIAGGWTQWAIRAAVAQKGNIGDAVAAQNFYARLAEEIRSACRTGRLDCSAEQPSFLPDPARISAADLGESLEATVEWLVRFRLGDQHTGARSSGQPQNWEVFATALDGLPDTLAQQHRLEHQYEAQAAPLVQRLTDTYALAMPLLALLGVAGVFAAALRRPQDWLLPWVVAVAALIAVTMRVGLVALVDATSFYAARTVYVLPASSFLLVLAFIGTWLLYLSLFPHAPLRGRSAPSSARSLANSARSGRSDR